MSTTKTDVTVANVSAQVAFPEDMLDEVLSHAGEGTDFKQSEMVIPFIRIAQSLSPQINHKKPEYIPGLQLGGMYNSVTGQFWSQGTGLRFVIAYQRTALLTFTPRANGGGFKGEIKPDDPRLLDIRLGSRNEELLPDGLELVRSDQNYGLVLDEDGSYQPAVLDMKSTQLKVSRRLKTQISLLRIRNPRTGQMVKPPIYASIWHFDSVEEKNDKGEFFNWSFSHAGYVSNPDVFAEARMFREAAVAGTVTTAPDAHEDATRSADTGSGRGHSSQPDDDIPF